MHLLLIDDSEETLVTFKEPLKNALKAQVDTVLHEGSSAAELTQQILIIKPDWVLLDGNLNVGVQGPELVPPLKDAGLKVIGFSSARWMREEFEHAGADGFVYKDTGDVPATILEIVRIVHSAN